MAEEATTSIPKLLVDALTKWFKTKKAKYAIVGFTVIVIGLAGMFNYQASAIPTRSLGEPGQGGGGGGGASSFEGFTDETATYSGSGNTNEGETSTESVTIGDENVFKVTVTLTWTDEADLTGRENQGDSFKVVVTAPDGDTKEGSGSNSHGSDGTVTVTLERDVVSETEGKPPNTDWSGDWSVNVTCEDAGDQKIRFGPGIIVWTDSGNAWSLDMEWTFKAEP